MLYRQIYRGVAAPVKQEERGGGRVSPRDMGDDGAVGFGSRRVAAERPQRIARRIDGGGRKNEGENGAAAPPITVGAAVMPPAGNRGRRTLDRRPC